VPIASLGFPRRISHRSPAGPLPISTPYRKRDLIGSPSEICESSRQGRTATLILNGKVLIAGGNSFEGHIGWTALRAGPHEMLIPRRPNRLDSSVPPRSSQHGPVPTAPPATTHLKRFCCMRHPRAAERREAPQFAGRSHEVHPTPIGRESGICPAIRLPVTQPFLEDGIPT
jgi:hypothetical protein